MESGIAASTSARRLTFRTARSGTGIELARHETRFARHRAPRTSMPPVSLRPNRTGRKKRISAGQHRRCQTLEETCASPETIARADPHANVRYGVGVRMSAAGRNRPKQPDRFRDRGLASAMTGDGRIPEWQLKRIQHRDGLIFKALIVHKSISPNRAPSRNNVVVFRMVACAEKPVDAAWRI